MMAELVAPVAMAPVSQAPLSAVAVCARVVPFDQVIVVPAVIRIGFGE
ncbi:MAG TPA: hypothetical protein VIT43_09015 [Candidatus Dormibacteraeota bacterium]